MVPSRTLSTAVAALALTASVAQAQPVSGPAQNGFVFNSGTQTFVDPAFDYDYSFRARGFTPTATGQRLLGAQGEGSPVGTPCVVGEVCQQSALGAYTRGANGAYQFRLDFGTGVTAPTFTVFNVDAFGAVVPGTVSTLTLANPVGSVLNTVFLQVRGGNSGGSLSVSNLGFNGAVFDATGLGNAATAPRYLEISYAGNLTGSYITGDISTQNLVGGSQETPSFDLYVGAVNSVPEPSTYALMATGLAALVGVARRRKASV